MWDRFPGGEVTNLIFNYFEGSNEGIVGREAEMRKMCKMWGKTVRAGVCKIPVRLPMNDGAMETVEYMRVDIWCMLDWIMSQNCKNAYPWRELLN